MASSPTPARRRALFVTLVLGGAFAATLATLGARAETPGGSVLHEFIPPNANDDLTYSATTLEGELPAAIQTPSGLATAPDPRQGPSGDHVYGGATTDDTPDSTYEPDRDTRRPHVENYDDPFSPATAPFKRLRAYDWVEADYSLHVRDKSLQKLNPGGSVAAGDEPFYGDISVDLIPGQPVRIPTVGPGARILRMHVTPELPVEVLHDGADNWFVRGGTRGRVRLVMELAISRDTFGKEFADVDWATLDAGHGGKPAGAKLHDAQLGEVTQAIGVSRAMRPKEAVRKMVDYFRSFAPSEEPPSGRGDIYLDLALSRKGVCRHRAFAFLVTALGLGVPARMVVNEAHAWVEVHDSRLWHRIDLGGAAANLENEADPSKPAYLPPPDPYAWPTARDSGQDLADKNRAQQSAGASGGGQGSGGDAVDRGADGGAGSGAGSSPGAPMPGEGPLPDPRLPEAEVTVGAIDGDVHRGLPLHLQGHVSAGGSACAHLRVDIVLVGHLDRASRGDRAASTAAGTAVGSLSTDEHGRYDGAVVVPRDLPLGDYDLVVQTPGDVRCGGGRTR